MNRCPVCEAQCQGKVICPQCGFDESRNYEAYQTLRQLPKGTITAISAQRETWRPVEQEEPSKEEPSKEKPGQASNQTPKAQKSDSGCGCFFLVIIFFFILAVVGGILWLSDTRLGPKVSFGIIILIILCCCRKGKRKKKN